MFSTFVTMMLLTLTFPTSQYPLAVNLVRSKRSLPDITLLTDNLHVGEARWAQVTPHLDQAVLHQTDPHIMPALSSADRSRLLVDIYMLPQPRVTSVEEHYVALGRQS